jgi:hypothetical protein
MEGLRDSMWLEPFLFRVGTTAPAFCFDTFSLREPGPLRWKTLSDAAISNKRVRMKRNRGEKAAKRQSLLTPGWQQGSTSQVQRYRRVADQERRQL